MEIKLHWTVRFLCDDWTNWTFKGPKQSLIACISATIVNSTGSTIRYKEICNKILLSLEARFAECSLPSIIAKNQNIL